MNSYKNFKGVFFNKLDIDNFDVLNKEEYKITSNRSDEILSGQVVLNNKNYGIEKLKAIHNHLFQDVYEWAGKIRTTPSSKTTNSIRTEFEIPSNILKSWELLENKTSTFVSKTDDNFNRKVEELSNIFVEANRIHPFPEGNGRTLQIFIKELAKEQKINLDFNKVNAAEWNMASAVSGKHGRLFDFAKENLPPPNSEPIKKIFLEISSPMIEQIRRVDFRDETRNQIQEDVALAVEANPGKFIKEFNGLDMSIGGKFISSDTFKETFEQYRESKESRNMLNNVVHNSASVLASEQLRRVLQEKPEARKDTVILLTGIPGAGKTSSVLFDKKMPDTVHAIYEGQLSDERVASQKVQQVLDAGFKPVIMVVHTQPEQALESTLKRFDEVGRGASINVMAKIQGGLPSGLNAVHNKFEDKVQLVVIDKREHGISKPLVGWQHLTVLKSEGNHEQIKQRLEQHLEHKQSTISPAAYRQAAGLTPVTRDTHFRDSDDQRNEHDVDKRNSAQGSRNEASIASEESSLKPKPI